MNIGELFVDLGVKGSEKTVSALTTMKKGLSEAASTSLETKAAIIGAMYALERLFAHSGAMGTNLTNFSALTGLSAKQLQQWQYAARQAGVANEDFTGSLKAVQTGMTNMLLGKGAPEGLQIVANKVGFDPRRARDTFYVLEQLQKFAKQAPADVGNAVLKSFGISEGVIAAMRRNAFTPEQFAKAPTYSDKEIDALNSANVAWSNLGVKIEMAIGHFNAVNGGQLVRDISKVVDQVVKLTEAFVKLSEKLELFQGISKIFEGWTLLLGGASKGIDTVSGAIHDPKKRDEAVSGIKDFFKEMPGVMKAMFEDIASPAAVASSGGSQQTVHVNQHLHFQHEGKEHHRVSDSVKKANQEAFRQFNQGQVN